MYTETKYIHIYTNTILYFRDHSCASPNPAAVAATTDNYSLSSSFHSIGLSLVVSFLCPLWGKFQREQWACGANPLQEHTKYRFKKHRKRESTYFRDTDYSFLYSYKWIFRFHEEFMNITVNGECTYRNLCICIRCECTFIYRYYLYIYLNIYIYSLVTCTNSRNEFFSKFLRCFSVKIILLDKVQNEKHRHLLHILYSFQQNVWDNLFRKV